MVGEGIDVLATRVSAEKADELVPLFPDGYYNEVARTFRIPLAADDDDAHSDCRARGRGHRRHERFAGGRRSPRNAALDGRRVTHLICDVGVAGPHRLIEHLNELADVDAVVVIAGMEGALPSVVGGHVACPVIAVPTSVGYGANLGGIAALLSMLNSCAANVTVVNIDAGFKGGYVAGLIAARTAKARREG